MAGKLLHLAAIGVAVIVIAGMLAGAVAIWAGA